MKFATIRNTGILTLAVAGTASAVLAAPAAITGQWVTQDRDAVVTVAQCGATLCGRISKYLVTPPNGVDQKDVNNPDKSLRSRKILGMAILTEFKADGKQWRGRIYDPRAGKTYRSVVYRGTSGNLIVKGCVGPICQTQTWKAR